MPVSYRWFVAFRVAGHAADAGLCLWIFLVPVRGYTKEGNVKFAGFAG